VLIWSTRTYQTSNHSKRTSPLLQVTSTPSKSPQLRRCLTMPNPHLLTALTNSPSLTTQTPTAQHIITTQLSAYKQTATDYSHYRCTQTQGTCSKTCTVVVRTPQWCIPLPTAVQHAPSPHEMLADHNHVAYETCHTQILSTFVRILTHISSDVRVRS
jgi:hypothetical protein